ncbi:hypothetical protein [Methylobacterium isbiliense]|uniref:VrrB protein n=1 Tax=Methylobacterium isbiliense TaxID=315478 RepID=A0ABQ4SJW3_9HYPH|nr:hypothetical protein [Methylobacterium isbiliense]MDN3625846.1 hypothetical protein [Methylobacterium isbiliense]GJE02839.1 hypothetical protein GMJLKIPL_4788 [Methylobacterium isbiliense]
MLKRTLPFLSALALAAAVSAGAAQAMPLGASVGLAAQGAPETVQQVQWWGHRHHHHGWGHHHHHRGWGHHHWGHHHHYYRPSYYGWGHHHHHHRRHHHWGY